MDPLEEANYSLFREILLYLFVILLYASAVKFLWNRHNRHRLFRNRDIPGPQPSILLGNLDELQSSPVPHDILSLWLRKYGNVFGYFIGEMPHLVVKDLDMLKKILIADFNVFNNRPFAFDVSPYDKSLLGLRDERWKEVRNILAKIFRTKKIKGMTDIINQKVNITVDIIAKKTENNEMFNIYELMQGLSVDVIADCALAMKTNCQENPQDVFFNMVRDTFKHVQNRAIKFAMMFPFISQYMVHLHKYSTAGKMTSYILSNLRKVISERRENPEFGREDILQLIMNHENGNGQEMKITDEEILANSFIFLVAGFETTANALSFTIDLLIKHPDIQERLYQEIADARNDEYDTIQSLQYLDQVINESLRIYPPATLFTSRKCNMDYRVGSITIPKGTAVVVPVWDIHHDPNLWPNPSKFDPERFSPANKASLNTMAYMPFGSGRRSCIGNKFAISEIKLVLFRLLKEFKFEICEKTEDPLTFVCSTTVIGPANGVYVRAIPRHEVI
ncbi:unnamed protein product [Larinioides sclopetarius]|uniref:Cytochrome P450 n=1 Tax=Larinioides sclopetarius TaxID=280406 RepID=A0AAV2ASL1_9ARAC